jgi:hypothetical protein
VLCRLSLAIALLTPCVQAQGALDAPLQRRVNEAIDDGVDALLAQQELDGSWRIHQDRYPGGMTALTAYALIKSGVKRDHQALRRAFGFLRSHPPEKTYSAACQLLAFAALGDPAEQGRIQDLADLLLSWHKSGGFGYPDGRMDLSNTQYAALALRAAAQSGVDVSDSFWDLLADRVMELQESFADDLEPAGFAYKGPRSVSASMTAAGVCVLAICKEQGAEDRRLEHALGVGLAWLGRDFTVRENRPQGSRHLYYYLYGLERLAGILGLERIGEANWYAEGAEYLVGQQEPDGRWLAQHQTAFALLFLTRATAPLTGEGARRPGDRRLAAASDADVRMRATGSSPLALWIESFGSVAGDLEWEGEAGQGPRVVRVEYRSRSRGADTVLQTVDGDSSAPSRDERYAARHVFERAGAYNVYVAVHVLQPGFEAGDPLSERVLMSPPVHVRIPQTWNEELLGYAEDPGRNLLATVDVAAEASSSLGELSEPRRAVDNLQASAWRSARGDAEPWLRLELEKPVRANTLLLSHAFNPAWQQSDAEGRIQRVALFVNGARNPLEIELVPDDWRKTTVVLERTTRVKKLELRVLGAAGGSAGGIGFGEVELQLRSGSKNR